MTDVVRAKATDGSSATGQIGYEPVRTTQTAMRPPHGQRMAPTGPRQSAGMSRSIARQSLAAYVAVR